MTRAGVRADHMPDGGPYHTPNLICRRIVRRQVLNLVSLKSAETGSMPELFSVEGCQWEKQHDNLYALHIDIGDEAHVAVWAYQYNSEYCVVRYEKYNYSGPEAEQWLGPIETLCMVHEALKERDAFLATLGSSKK